MKMSGVNLKEYISGRSHAILTCMCFWTVLVFLILILSWMKPDSGPSDFDNSIRTAKISELLHDLKN